MSNKKIHYKEMSKNKFLYKKKKFQRENHYVELNLIGIVNNLNKLKQLK